MRGRPPGSRPLPLLQLPRDPLLGLASAVAAASSLAGAVYTLDQVTGVLLEVRGHHTDNTDHDVTSGGQPRPRSGAAEALVPLQPPGLGAAVLRALPR